jgi:phosphatidylglycerophosphate synthase
MGNDPYRAGERRPIAVRDWRVFQRLAGVLARWGVSPNAISLAGMGSGVAAGASLAATAVLTGWEQRLAWLAGALFIQLRLLANMLDGMVAVEGCKASPVGALYNEIPDRVSDVAVLVGLGYAQGGETTLGYLAACVALFTAYVRAQGRAAGAPQEFCGPMAKQQRMFTVTVVGLYCALTPIAWQPADDFARGLPALALALIIVLGLATSWRRIVRIASNLKKMNSLNPP